ncbi:hypothetical protein ACR6C2_07640 [Streptomyces sp. INA 01156]
MTGTTSSLRPTPAFGEALLAAAVSLVAAANNTWTNTGLTVALPGRARTRSRPRCGPRSRGARRPGRSR